MTALSFVFFGGCQKESALLNQDSLQGKNESKIDPKYKAPSVEDAQNWFEQSFGKTHTIITKVGDSTQSLVLNVRGSSPQIDVTPIWSNAQISSYLSNRQVLMMPVNTISALQKRGVGYCAVFFKDSVGKIGYTLQVTATKPNYLASHEHLSVNDFSGVFLQIIPNGQIKNTLVVDEGKIIGAFKVSSANQFNLSGNPPCNCGTWDDMWNAILVDLWGSGGFTTHDPFSGIIYGDASLYDPPGGSAGIPVYYPPIILNSEIDNTLFDVSGQTVKFSFYQDIYMRQLSLTDTEFEVLYFDKKLFTLVDGFLNNNTFSVSSVKIIKYLINNHAFANSNKITNIFTILNSNEPLLFPDGSGGPEFEINPIEYLKCFKSRPNSTFKVSVNVSQPVQNDRKVNQGTDAGHTFLTLEQSFDGQTVRKSIGFYPNSAWETVFGAPNQAPLYVNNQLKGYDVSITSTLNESQFMGIVENIRTYTNSGYRYDLHTFNCSTFAINAVEGFGFSLPRTEVPFSKGQGITPSNLAEDIRTMTLQSGQTRDISSGKKTPTANSSSSDCN